MIDLRYLRPGDVIRVDREDGFVHGHVTSTKGSARFPLREVEFVPLAPPGVRVPIYAPRGYINERAFSCLRREITGVWHADAQTRRSYQGRDAYAEWVSNQGAA